MDDIVKDKKKVKIYYSLLITVICIIGVSYAFFQLFLKQSDNNTLVSRTCFDTSLTENTEKIVLENAYPVVDSEGLKGTPFTFTLKNNCSSYIRLYITIDSEHRDNLGTTYLDDNYIKVNISPKGTTNEQSVVLGSKKLTDLDNNRKGYIIVNTGLQANKEKSFDLRLWMDEAVTLEQGLGKSWEGKIVVIGEAASGPLLNETILANNEVKTPLTTPGKEVSAHTKDDVESQTVSVDTEYQAYYITYGTGWTANGTKFNLTGTGWTADTYANSYSSLVGKYLVSHWIPETGGSSTAETMIPTTNLSSVYYVVSATSSGFTYKIISSNKNTTEALLASTEDDYGTSYYFRGAVKNNYVEFANKCWRIVRIGGDGSVKLILHNDNTTGVADPCDAANNSWDAAFARYNTQYTDYRSHESAFNYNYDDNAYVGFMYGITGASDYASTHANINKSIILTNLETWYTNNLASYESKLADTIWCNDKTNVTDTTFDPEGWHPNGLGYAKNVTYYGATQRLASSSGSAGGTGPSLRCNGELNKITAKIGLITADETAFAGSTDYTSNRSTYLLENTGGNPWWSLSPYGFDGSDASVWVVYMGYLGDDNVLIGLGLRPVISLISSATISGGSGTSEDPYVVK